MTVAARTVWENARSSTDKIGKKDSQIAIVFTKENFNVRGSLVIRSAQLHVGISKNMTLVVPRILALLLSDPRESLQSPSASQGDHRSRTRDGRNEVLELRSGVETRDQQTQNPWKGGKHGWGA
jgi:hypothetical protein